MPVRGARPSHLQAWEYVPLGGSTRIGFGSVTERVTATASRHGRKAAR
ncbi:hypothetical protein J8N05_20810 [Streptomyces sp. BH-SS-21]|uniref:Uncharacterized protein n=1 Tax=Streptomyces liliiviolaceus TaxID=2823109 RepID=A0A940XVC9_9ACTN|nr:hypothetical protein [Streptomyces liliiviolaceus]MBQ0850610.1 hypothetical protein [Streptomyces liliiviolaceus]